MKQYKNAIDEMISFIPFQDASKKWYIGRYVDGEFYETYERSFKTEKECEKRCAIHFNHWSK
jgi:hypothetical protein